MSKFAPITASLLARKGEAEPSISEVKNPFVWAHEHSNSEISFDAQDWAAVTAASEAASFRVAIPSKSGMQATRKSAKPRNLSPSESMEKSRRISIALSSQEHETLGIVAVKKGLTRHQLVRNALNAYLEALAKEYRFQCGCIATGSCPGECST